MSVSFQETSKPLPRWAEKLAKSNIFPSAWLTKCSNCTMASRNKTSCNVQAFNENNDLDFKERSQTEKVDGDSQEPESSSLSWSEVSRKLDRLNAKFSMAATVAKAPAITNVQTTPPQVAHNKVVTSNGNTKIVFNGRQDTSGGYQPQFVIQKLSVTRLPNIVNRMRTETLSSRAKRSRFYKSDSYVDYRCYSWRNLALWSDYQAHLWKGDGSVKTSYRK
uniref:Uncharacterized protein n=1 Tax=Magallana gigas TaxID=29159 RepID=K1PRF4_MAGGI